MVPVLTIGANAKIRIQELAWEGDLTTHALAPTHAKFDLLIGSDICYDDEDFEALLSVIRQYAAHNPDMLVRRSLQAASISELLRNQFN